MHDLLGRNGVRRGWVIVGMVWLCVASRAFAIEPEAYNAVERAQQLRKQGEAVEVSPDGNLYCEGEEFQVQQPGWKARPWGENYYAATFANTFLSRKAFLGAPADCPPTTATINVSVPKAGRYLVLVRYEAAYRFETQFRVKVEQQEKTALNRLYGARKNLKVWAFGQKLKDEVGWSWGAVENVVWEGHDAFAELQPGLAKITLTAGPQPGPGAKRNIDLVVLTTDRQQVEQRIQTERYLPLDGMCTQGGDVWMQVTNPTAKSITFGGGAARGNFTEHSPYWIHQRAWHPFNHLVKGGTTSPWFEVGTLMDSLNDGQWRFNSSGPCEVAIGVKLPGQEIQTIRKLTCPGNLDLIGLADLRYSRKIQTHAEGVAELIGALRKVETGGKLPREMLILAHTSIPELLPLFGIANVAEGAPPLYRDFRSRGPAELEALLKKIPEAERNSLRVISLGDEIGLPAPPAATAQASFAQYLQAQNLHPEDLLPGAGSDWSKIPYDPNRAHAASHPAVFYHSQKYLRHYGVAAQKSLTDVLRKYLPHAEIGANFSPHGSFDHAFLGDVHQWVNCFRNDGMTLPWGEDYAWQLPIGTPQMNGICLDLFRAGNRGKSNRKILYYVMPHMPGNTPAMWRRMFFNALGHGMKIMNLFEFNPVWAAYTENHVTGLEMYAAVLQGIRELGTYEDIILTGERRPGDAALWFSEASDIWSDKRLSFPAAKRALYVAIQGRQLQLDFLIDQDAARALDQYRVLYLTDAHVTRESSRNIADWVRRGGRLFATAGAGQFDEWHQPNRVLQELLGVVVEQERVAEQHDQIGFIKQDLPFAKPLDTVTWGEQKIPAFGIVNSLKTAGADVEVVAQFSKGSPAVVRRSVGQGETLFCGFLPSLSYFHPAIPLLPLDRGSTDDAMAHFIPHHFDRAAGELIGLPAHGLRRIIECSEPLVEASLIDSPRGTAIVLANWSSRPVQNLQVRVNLPTKGSQFTLASGKPVKVTRENGEVRVIFVLDLDVGDVIIRR